MIRGIVSVFALAAAASAQDCARPTAEQVLAAVRDRYGQIQSIEYLAAFKSGRQSSHGVDDYVCTRYKLSKPDRYWSEIYHSDASCVTGLDPERTIRIGDPQSLRTVKPWFRTLRIEPAEKRHVVVSRPDPFLSVVAWWPSSHELKGPKVGRAPLSITDALAGAEDWQAEALDSPGRYELRSATLRTSFEVDEAKGWAVRARETWRGRMRTRYEVTAFREHRGFWLPASVQKIAITEGVEARKVLARGEVKEVAVNRLASEDFETPAIPGLLQVNGLDGQTKFRQVIRGGEDLLAARARRLRHRLGEQDDGAWLRYLIAAGVGLLLCLVVRRTAA